MRKLFAWLPGPKPVKVLLMLVMVAVALVLLVVAFEALGTLLDDGGAMG